MRYKMLSNCDFSYKQLSEHNNKKDCRRTFEESMNK